jgi:gamma-glutamyltranspeptidase/glutathione hydrolase
MHRSLLRRIAARIAMLGLAALALASCGGSDSSSGGSAPARPLRGAVIADEPRAALVGRDILLRGGSAADAAVATYFAMAVTLPSVATLGGGGVCLAYDGQLNRAEVVEFVAQAPRSRGIAAIPGNARGMFALHAKYGRLRWEQVLAPAEGLARFGVETSRATAEDIAQGWSALSQDAVAFRIFGKPPPDFAQRVAQAARDPRAAQALRAAFRPLAEGDRLVQEDLANFISLLRRNGGLDMHDGAAAQAYVAGTARAQAPLSASDLANALPQLQPALQVTAGEVTIYTPPPPVASGVMVGQIVSLAAPQWRNLSAAERANVLAQASLLAHWDRERWQRPDLSSGVAGQQLVSAARVGELAGMMRAAGRIPPQSLNPPVRARPLNAGAGKLVVVDGAGNAVACATSANGLFGLARVAPGTGVVIAAASNANDNGMQWLAPALVGRRNGVLGGVVGGGGAATPAVVSQVLLATMVERRPLDEAIAAPRMNYTGAPDQAGVEEGASDLMAALRAAGYATQSFPPFGRTIGFSCPDGIARAERCAFASDPREPGMAITAN